MNVRKEKRTTKKIMKKVGLNFGDQKRALKKEAKNKKSSKINKVSNWL